MFSTNLGMLKVVTFSNIITFNSHNNSLPLSPFRERRTLELTKVPPRFSAWGVDPAHPLGRCLRLSSWDAESKMGMWIRETEFRRTFQERTHKRGRRGNWRKKGARWGCGLGNSRLGVVHGGERRSTKKSSHASALSLPKVNRAALCAHWISQSLPLAPPPSSPHLLDWGAL